MTSRILKLSLVVLLSACEGPAEPEVASQSRAVLNASQCNKKNNGAPCGTDCTQMGVCQAGACVNTVPVADGTPCRSPNFCMANTTCMAGVCEGGTPVSAGTPCQTGNICTLDDHCDGVGACVAGSAVDCNDFNPSTVDSCVPDVGCVHSSAAADTVGHYEGGVGGCDMAPTSPSSSLFFAIAALALLSFRRRSSR